MNPSDTDAKRSRTLSLLVALTVAVWVVNLASMAAASWLLAHHPLLLVGLDARNRNLILVTPLIESGILVVLVASFRRLIVDPVYFALGRVLVERDVTWMGMRILGGTNSGRFMRTLERAFERFSWPLVFFFPGMFVCILAGASRMRVRTFAMLNISGTVLVVIATRQIALRAVGGLTEVAEWNAEQQVLVTVLLVVVVVVTLFQRRRRGRQASEERGDGKSSSR